VNVERPQPFHGLVDTVAELNRMRQFWRVGVETSGHETSTTYYVRERQYGSFRRTINLPAAIQRSDVDAAQAHGLLEITVAGGAMTSPPERIDIRGGEGERQ
jgi:HSP20 family molecular chaperone IbpA